MSVINHNVIIATTWNNDVATKLREWIEEFRTSLVVEHTSQLNGYQTFVVCPDGSQEGWTDSDSGDHFREMFVQRLLSDNYDDDSSPWAWVEVGFGEFGQKVLRGNNINCYSDKEYEE